MLSPLFSLLLSLLSFHHTVNCSSLKPQPLSVTISSTPADGSCSTPHIVLNSFLNFSWIQIVPRTSKGTSNQMKAIVVNQFDNCSLTDADSIEDLALFRNCSPEQRRENHLHRLPACSFPDPYYYYTTKNPDLFELNCTTLVYSPSDQDGGTGSLTGVDVSVLILETKNGRKHARVMQFFSSNNLEDCPTRSTTRGKQHQTRINKELFGVLAALVSAILLTVFLCLYVRREKNTSTEHRERAQRRSSRRDEDVEGKFMKKFQKLAPKRYTYSDVEKITSCFCQKLGHGGYGNVFRGQLDDGRPVAVKVLNDSKGSMKDFFAEVISIGCTYHVNVVALLGFCLEGSRRVLIYEFLANGSLGKLISDRKLDTAMQLEIAIGVARGLEYLHHGCNIGILHFDIKPQNILLDEHFCPKIADFGLAKLCRSSNGRIKMLKARGTVGYIAPEVLSRQYGAVSSKSDVYSFGMMVLEMVGGRTNSANEVDRTSEICFPHWICRHLDMDGNLKTMTTTSSSLGTLTEAEEEMAKRMVIVGLRCIQMKPSDRPTMTKVLDMLEGRVTELRMPPMDSVDRVDRGIQFPESINVSGPRAHLSESGSYMQV